MRSTLLLTIFAVVCVTYIQCQDCSAVNACIGNDFREKIGRKSQVADFPSVCIDYKYALDCINAVTVAGCQVAAAAAFTTLNDLTHNTCGPDGKLIGCGHDIYQCVLQAQNILLDYKNNNVMAACPVVTKFSTCANAIKANTECDAGLVASLVDAETMFKQDTLLTRCYGPCAAAIGNCTLGLTTDISGLSITQTNWTSFCRDSFTALGCMKNFTATSVCSSTSGAQFLRAQLASQNAYLKDYCDASGRPSQCVVGLSMCNTDIVSLTPQSDIKTQCAAAAKFLECTSSLPCEQELAALVQDMRNQFQTGERTTNCPTVGSCSHRLAYCQSAEDELKAIHDAMTSSVYCRIAMSASRCFEFVRNDPICYRENMIVDGFEISLVTNIVPTCGAVTGTCVERLKICDSFEYIIRSITTTTGIIIYCGLTERVIDCFERTRISGRCSEPKTSFENRIISLWQEICNASKTTTPPTTTSTTRGTTTTTTTATTGGTTTTTTTSTTRGTTHASQHFTTDLPATATGQSGNVRHDFICHFATVEIFIPISEAPNAVLRLRDPSCVLVNNGTHHVITFPFNTCGTSVTSFKDYSIVTNYVTVHTDLHVSAPVVFGNDYNISLECQVPEHMVLDGSFQAVTKEPAQQVNANPQMGFHLREYTSADYTQEITKYPVQVSINKEIFLEVTLADETSRNTTLGVKVNECRATPSPDPHDSTSYQLIRDSCPATPAVHLQSSPSPETYRFSVQTFHFSGNTNNDDVVYIHCDVSICHDDKCGLRCGASGGARRKRRSRLSKRSALGSTLTSGPHIIVNESETKQ